MSTQALFPHIMSYNKELVSPHSNSFNMDRICFVNMHSQSLLGIYGEEEEE